MDMLSCNIGGIASRTPVNLGEAVHKVMNSAMPEYTVMPLEHTPQYLLFGFWRRTGMESYSFIVVIGDRYRGQVATEVGINTRNKYPYYSLSSKPQLGTFGFRERSTVLMTGDNWAHIYRSKNEMNRVVNEAIVMYAAQGLRILNDKIGIEVEKAKSTWIPLYEEWQLAEQAGPCDSKCRYPNLQNEEIVRNYIDKKINEPITMRFLGKLRSNYKEADFLNCQVYLMCRTMEFIESGYNLEFGATTNNSSNDKSNKNRITWADITGKSVSKEEVKVENIQKPRDMTDAPNDVILSLTGRFGQDMTVHLTNNDDERAIEFAFYKSLSVMEGIYRPNAFFSNAFN